MKKILLLDGSDLFRAYLADMLKGYNFSIVECKNAIEAFIAIRRENPALIIMDYNISGINCVDFLIEKNKKSYTEKIPVILLSSPISQLTKSKLSELGVTHFFFKPVKVDELILFIEDLLCVNLLHEEFPCVIEAHFNNGILFIEIFHGINSSKLIFLKHKIAELMNLYKMKKPKVLIMITNINEALFDKSLLDEVFRNVIRIAGTAPALIKVLTNSKFINNYLISHKDYYHIQVIDNLLHTFDHFFSVKKKIRDHEYYIHQALLSGEKHQKEEFVRMNGGEDRLFRPSKKRQQNSFSVALINDDTVIRRLVKKAFNRSGWNIEIYSDEEDFLWEVEEKSFDILFIDFMMPVTKKERIFESLKDRAPNIPIVVLSVIPQKESLMTTGKMGSHSYIIKTEKPYKLFLETAEILNSCI